ncbi:MULTISPECIES: hypothetical protein [unclassified Devosia]|uniref:hypothetical protein n=1 Tax=unclassified Devosia TaxID=196773 RepID=UPI00145C40E3|nr:MULTISPECIES: hypothetical protein [unclassified Devosia]MBJ6987261.1 hypothetical protein [Devosia sp. MC521]QMW62869.1 hypothetical protein H4N61_00405 [Devosia sp. MC521]
MAGLTEFSTSCLTVDGATAVQWMRQVISHLATAPQPVWHRRKIFLADLQLELVFDDASLADDYVGILSSRAVEDLCEHRIFILTGTHTPEFGVPRLDQSTCSPEAFQHLARAAGLRAAYPFQEGTWKFYDTERRIGVQLTERRETLPLWDATAPLRQHLHWIFDEHEQRLAHAATLGLNGAGIVMFGAGGAGKSGTTLAGLSVGLKTVGDDYIALDLAGSCLARALYRVVKQDRSGLARLPHLQQGTADLADNWRGKVMFNPDRYFLEPFVSELRLGAVVLPHIAHAAVPALRPAKAREVMLALMTSNLFQFPAEQERGMSFYAKLLRQLPCFHLDLSADAEQNGRLLKAFIEANFPHDGMRFSAELTG